MRNPTLKLVKRRERILVVEDDPPSRQAMVDVLAAAGYSIDEAEDGYEALWLAARQEPDLVLSDLSMPGLDGVELTRRIHTFARDIPVILTTGLADTQDYITAAQSYGAVACLKKPMSLDELLWTIDRALACRREGTGPHAGSASIH
jgi:CheY-like chemotaxis protein